MQIEVLKSKIHRVRVTGAELDYIGSITIDEALLEASNMIEGEKVSVVDVFKTAYLTKFTSFNTAASASAEAVGLLAQTL